MTFHSPASTVSADGDPLCLGDMLNRAAIDAIIPLLRRAASRALRLKVKGFARPYYCSFVLRDIQSFNVQARRGSIYKNSSERARPVFCDLRVGSYRYDQVIQGGLADDDEDRESSSLTSLPIDTRINDEFRHALWRLVEARFREALTDYNTREALSISMFDANRALASFTKLPPLHHVNYSHPEPVDQDKWLKFCKKASEFVAELPHVSQSWVEFESVQETKIFVSTERRVIVQHSQTLALIATMRKLLRDGTHIEQDLVLNCADGAELPTLGRFQKLLLKKHEVLMRMARGRKIHAFSGPALLMPGPAGLLFHEALGHRLEGNRLLSNDEGQTFRDQVGTQILNVDVNVRDNPRMRSFSGQRCVGAYRFDDEGAEAQSTLLVEGGKLHDFLTTRAAIRKHRFVSNGHARNKDSQRPVSRMGVLEIEGKKTVTFEELKKRLVREIRRQKKPCGMIIYDTLSGETETTRHDPQAFYGEISYATLLYPNGKEVPVRGVNFVGTPLQSLHNITAVGDSRELDNSFCGAESGFIPVSTIAPAVLVSHLELQAKEESRSARALLPRPS